MSVTVAAAVLFVSAVGLGVHRWTWPDGRAWSITDADGLPDRLEVGRTLRLGPADEARVAIARIGTMEVQPGSAITLRSTATSRHRLVLTEGAVSVRVWAPPGTVEIKTPAGDVVDLGCAFRLAVGPAGAAHVSVESGWVQLDSLYGESLVPAGASSTMTPGTRPGAPIFDDAALTFREGIRGLETHLGDDAASAALEFLGDARPRDVLTLLLVAKDAHASVARPLLERAATLRTPPQGVTVNGIVEGDRSQLWRWQETLDLPPLKGWWRNWRDALRPTGR